MASQQPQITAYGLSQALINVFPAPIIAQRNPGFNDKAQYGTVWINQASQSVYILVSIVNNVANWVGIYGDSGVFTYLTVLDQLLLASTAAYVQSNGNFSVGTGSDTDTINIGTGGARTTNIGNMVGASALVLAAGSTGMTIESLTGSIEIEAPTISIDAATSIGVGADVSDSTLNIGTAATAGKTINIGNSTGTTAVNIKAGSGGVNIPAGNLTVTLGNIIVSTGDLTVATNIIAEAGALIAGGTDATPGAGNVAYTNVVTAVSTGSGGGFTINPVTGTGFASNYGFLTIYLGSTPYYIPIYSTTV